MSYKYPVYQPSMVGNEKKYVNDCLDSNWISSKGKYVSAFEKKFCEFTGVKYAASVCNGTVALHLALVSLGIKEGDEVIVPTLTYIASVNAIKYTGATPIFVDSEKDTWQISIEDIKKKITPKTKAIICVHLYGHPCDMDALVSVSRDNDIFLVEDCAEALGTKYKGTNVGTFGDVSIYSFYGNKTVTTGEGGMVVTNDETLFNRIFHFKSQGLAKHREYWHDVIGYNYRMTNICAAIGLAQLEKVDETIAKKRKIADWYQKYLPIDVVELHQEAEDCVHSYWMCSILLKEPGLREPLRDHLKENGVETRPLFYPVHTMPMYSSHYERHKVAEDLGWRGINLPSYPALNEEDIQEICETITSFFE